MFSFVNVCETPFDVPDDDNDDGGDEVLGKKWSYTALRSRSRHASRELSWHKNVKRNQAAALPRLSNPSADSKGKSKRSRLLSSLSSCFKRRLKEKGKLRSRCERS